MHFAEYPVIQVFFAKLSNFILAGGQDRKRKKGSISGDVKVVMKKLITIKIITCLDDNGPRVVSNEKEVL